jgi:hypothetical protein
MTISLKRSFLFVGIAAMAACRTSDMGQPHQTMPAVATPKR